MSSQLVSGVRCPVSRPVCVNRHALNPKFLRAERIARKNFIVRRCASEETEPEVAEPEVKANVCQTCGADLNEAPQGCDRLGRIPGGMAAIAEWWPIKAYRPCPALEAAGKSYVRKGQLTNEMLFGRKDRNTL